MPTPMPLPDRPLRRQPYDHEVKAATDFAALDVAYEDAAERLHALFLDGWLVAQTSALAAQIEAADSAASLAAIRAPVVGVEALADELTTLAIEGHMQARDELAAQGVTVGEIEDASVLRALVSDHAAAVAQQVADGVSIAASRKAVQLHGVRTAQEVAEETAEYLGGLKHAWEKKILDGAVQQALNAGRFEVFEQVEAVASIYASELNDASTCGPCVQIDGTEFATMEEARRAYPTGGYFGCDGGGACRGTIVLVGDES